MVTAVTVAAVVAAVSPMHRLAMVLAALPSDPPPQSMPHTDCHLRPRHRISEEIVSEATIHPRPMADIVQTAAV